jgi:hypothetical protein
VGIDCAQLATIEGATHDESFGVKWREIKFHYGKMLTCFGEVDGFVFGSGNGGGCWCWSGSWFR